MFIIGTIAYAVMFQVPRRFYIGCGITDRWMMMYKFASVLFGCSCVLVGTVCAVLVAQNVLIYLPEMSDHYLYDFGYH